MDTDESSREGCSAMDESPVTSCSSATYTPFSLKRWNACALWSWDVETDTCAICRVQLMEECIKCQTEGAMLGGTTGSATATPSSERTGSRGSASTSSSSYASAGEDKPAAGAAQGNGASARVQECVVVWGECGHAFHNCCMGQWVRQNPRCPLCQKDWIVQRIGK